MDAGVEPGDEEQVVLEELYDENYEPTDAEILEYAKWLGMDTENEQELLWIARAGLKEPVPEGWKPCQAPSKEIYYFNFITGESIWDHPCDEHFRSLYAREKQSLLERREQEAAQLQDQHNQGRQYYQQQQQQQQQHQQQQQPQQQQQQQQQQQPQHSKQDYQVQNPGLQQQQQLIKAATLVVPENNGVQHTEVENMTSPSGTLSTIASGTTVSVVESPVGGLAHSTGVFSQAGQQQASGAANNRANGVASYDETPQISPAPAAAGGPAARRTLMGPAEGAEAALAAAAAASGDWRAADAAADQEKRLQFRQQLEDERRTWEEHLQADVHAQHNALQQQHQQRLWELDHALQEQERMAAEQLKAEQDARLGDLRLELQATLKSLEQELLDAKAQHTAHMQQLRSQHADLEAHANSMLQQAQQRLSNAALADSELSAARDKAAAAVELEATAEASSHRSELLQAAKQRVEAEVAAEVEAYKASRRAEALQQLAGHLSDDTTAAAQQLEKQTAELQRLETAVADTAAVLQKLNDEVASKQQQQQQLVHSWSSAGEHYGDAQLLRSCTDQLAGVQQQLAQAEKQLSVADAALADKRAAVAEAEEQLAAVRHETSVCEPRLGSLRQQLHELESNIRARDTEHQQRQADVALSSKRLAELREEVTRRQGQLDSLEALYAERQDSLRQTAHELAWRRGELSTLESSLSESLRRKADAEYQSLEDSLRRTRKAAADAAAELSARQATLAELSAAVSSKQVSLEGVEASLAAKSKELQEVLGQLQAAAAQEFQDSKKLLLEEEARLLESERRSMRLRVTDQVESERRAALAAGRRRIEREVSARLAEEQATTLEHQQKQVKKWLEAAPAGLQPLGALSSPGPAANGERRLSGYKQAHDGSGLGVAAVLGQISSWREQQQQQQQQQQHSTDLNSVRSLPDAAAGGYELPPAAAAAAAAEAAAAADAAPVGGSRRRARSYSPVRQRHSTAEQALLGNASHSINSLTQDLNRLLQHQQQPFAASGAAERSGGLPAASHSLHGLLAQQQHQQQQLQKPQVARRVIDVGTAAGLQAAAAAVAGQLKLLAAQQGDSWSADASSLYAYAAAGSGSTQLAAYASLLQTAKQFIKQRRREVQQRQEAVMAAQADWKTVLAAMEEQQQLHLASGAAVPAELVQALQQLKQLKGVLQDQIHTLNDETQQVKGLKARVQKLKASIELAELGGPQQEQPCAMLNNLSSLLSSLSGLQHRQQQWQQQQQQQQAPSWQSARVPLLSQHQAPQQWSSGLPPLSPIDKVTAALQAALNAATGLDNSGEGREAAGVSTGGAGAATSAAASSSRRSSLQPSGVAAGGLSKAPDLAAEGSWGTLSKLREERGAAQQAMQQHSQWLQGFRQQVAHVASLQPAVATKLQQQSQSSLGPLPEPQRFMDPVSSAAMGGADGRGDGSLGSNAMLSSAGLSPVASSSLLPMASTGSLSMGQPLTLDLGADQLVISLVHKGAKT